MSHSYYIVAVLVAINLLNYMDRFTIAGVLVEVQEYFDINAATAGLLQTSFIVSYMVFSPLFGFLGDRFSRKLIVILGVLFWSIVTLSSSFVRPHHTILFFLFRALVGIGEASYATVAPTLIADLFIGSQRSTMLAIFYFAIPVGSGLGYITGISMKNIFGHWTYALRFTPILGMISVIGFMFVKEPIRGEIEQTREHSSRESNTQIRNVRSLLQSIKQDILYLISIPTYIYCTLGFTCVCFSVGSLAWWAPTFMQTANSDSSQAKVGLIFGIIACVGGLVGVLIGYGGSKYFRSRYPTADPWVCASGVLLSVPFSAIAIGFARISPTTAWIFMFLAITFLSTNWSVVADISLYIIVPHRRSTAQSLQILTSHILGDASSPFIIGAISDALKNDGDMSKFYSLMYALYLTPIILILGGIFFAFSARYILDDEHNCKKMISSDNNVSIDGIDLFNNNNISDSDEKITDNIGFTNKLYMLNYQE